MTASDGVEIVCVGETLVDFLPAEPGRRVAEVKGWVPCSGGSPANVAVGLARLGRRSAMLGVVGEDEFGVFLRQSLAAEGVDVSRLRQTREGKTGLVFVSLTASGERSFSFFRTRSAEIFLGMQDVDAAFLGGARAVHVGTNSLLLPEAREAMRAVVQSAAAAGKLVSCDPNLRLHYWPDPRELRDIIHGLLPWCTVLKLSDEETEFVTGTSDPDRALAVLAERGVRLPIVTHGEHGASLGWRGERIRVPSVPARVVDTTGAGDGFVAAFLSGLVQRFPDARALEAAEPEALEALARFACACAARVVERVGAVAGLPRLDEVRGLPGFPGP